MEFPQLDIQHNTCSHFLCFNTDHKPWLPCSKTHSTCSCLSSRQTVWLPLSSYETTSYYEQSSAILSVSFILRYLFVQQSHSEQGTVSTCRQSTLTKLIKWDQCIPAFTILSLNDQANACWCEHYLLKFTIKFDHIVANDRWGDTHNGILSMWTELN